MAIKYKILATQIFNRGLKKKIIAHELGITPRSLNNKISGLAPFTWDQACLLHRKFFPDMSKDCLFRVDNDSEESATKEVS